MNYLKRLFTLIVILNSASAFAQELTGTPVTDTTSTQYLLPNWYSGIIRMNDDKVFDGVYLRYNLAKDQIEVKKDSGTFRIEKGVKEFNIPSGSDLYIFRSGFAPYKTLTTESFYRVIYDGKTQLLKRYQSPIQVEKAAATRTLEPDAKLYVVKDSKVNEVFLKDQNSFLKLLADEKNKMRYVIKEENLEFDAEDDLMKLLEEYDAYKAGRGGN